MLDDDKINYESLEERLKNITMLHHLSFKKLGNKFYVITKKVNLEEPSIEKVEKKSQDDLHLTNEEENFYILSIINNL